MPGEISLLLQNVKIVLTVWSEAFRQRRRAASSLPARPAPGQRRVAQPALTLQLRGWRWAERAGGACCIPLPPCDPQGRLVSKQRKDARRGILFNPPERREGKSHRPARPERSEILCGLSLPSGTSLRWVWRSPGAKPQPAADTLGTVRKMRFCLTAKTPQTLSFARATGERGKVGRGERLGLARFPPLKSRQVQGSVWCIKQMGWGHIAELPSPCPVCPAAPSASRGPFPQPFSLAPAAAVPARRDMITSLLRWLADHFRLSRYDRPHAQSLAQAHSSLESIPALQDPVRLAPCVTYCRVK